MEIQGLSRTGIVGSGMALPTSVYRFVTWKTSHQVLARNSIAYTVAIFAAARIGAVAAVLPSMALSQDIAYYLEASSAKIVFYDQSTAEELAKAWKGSGPAPYIPISLDETRVARGVGHNSIWNLAREGQRLRDQSSDEPAWTIPHGQSNRKICAYMAFSSGTTGRPKTVMISHANMIAQCMQMHLLIPGKPGPLLALLPFYHITGLVHLLHLPLLLDQEVIIMGEFDMASMLSTVAKYRCEELWLVPPLLIRMVTEDVVKAFDLSFVRQFNTGAAPLSAQVVEKLAVAFPAVALRQAYGMTESCSCLTVTPPGLATYANAAKVGKLVPGTDLKVIDVNTGKPLGLDQEGELWFRGPQITMGYRNNDEETLKTYDSDGFLHTGDLGAIHGDGFVMIYDRLKELIKVRGHGVAPAELEDVLHGHPHVADVAVIGIPHHYSGEVPKAYVVLKDGVPPSSDTAKALEEHVEKFKARYMRLAGGVEFMWEIPKTASGKILRKVLRERHNEQTSGQPNSKL